jgi:hypothetical protein
VCRWQSRRAHDLVDPHKGLEACGPSKIFRLLEWIVKFKVFCSVLSWNPKEWADDRLVGNEGWRWGGVAGRYSFRLLQCDFCHAVCCSLESIPTHARASAVVIRQTGRCFLSCVAFRQRTGVLGGCAMWCSVGWWGVDGAHGVDANRNWPKSGRRMPTTAEVASAARCMYTVWTNHHFYLQQLLHKASCCRGVDGSEGWAWLRAEKRRLHEPVLLTHWPTHLSHR